VPYEGPDTQTTNSYVLKAEPPSPRNFDPTVPEPLAAIALKALKHDPKVRFANGNDAEAALGKAWDVCLQEGLVPLSAFASASGLPGRASGPPEKPSPPPTPTPGGSKGKGAAKGPPPPPNERQETDGPTTIFAGGNAKPSSEPVPNAIGPQKTDRVQPARPTPPPVLGKGQRADVLQPVALKKSSASIWVVLILLLAAGAAVGIYFYMKQGGPPP